MRDRLREWGLAGAVGVIVVVGLLIEAFAAQVGVPVTVPPSGDRFVERSVYCPPSLDDTKTIVTAASRREGPVTIGVEPARPEEVELDAGRVLVQPLTEGEPADVVGYGAPVVAGALVRSREPIAGEGATTCARGASPVWMFAGGASTLGADQRLLIYNPFPDEAVVRVKFLTPSGENRVPNLSDVPVPADSAAFVRVNQFVRLERSLATVVEAKRGHVVAWRVLFDTADEGPGGAQMSLGATRSFPTWYFPEGFIAPRNQMRLALANPNDEEATVTVSLLTSEEVVQPEALVEIDVPPLTSRSFAIGSTLTKRQRDLGGVSAVVQSTNNVGIIAERVMRYSVGDVKGSTAEVGAPRLGTRWVLLPATLNPTTDTVVVMNPGSAPADLSVTLHRVDGAPLTPARLQGRALDPGGRIKLGLGEWTQGEPVVVMLTATAPVAAERFSYSTIPDDVGAVMGLLLGDSSSG